MKKPTFKAAKPSFDDKVQFVRDTHPMEDVVFISPTHLLDYMKTALPNDSFDVTVRCVYFTRSETQAEYDQRYAQYLAKMDAWYKERERFFADLKQWEDNERKQKEERDLKYKDPEYIEFLRLKAKMKERGLEG
jgi:hypothetical protein